MFCSLHDGALGKCLILGAIGLSVDDKAIVGISEIGLRQIKARSLIALAQRFPCPLTYLLQVSRGFVGGKEQLRSLDHAAHVTSLCALTRGLEASFTFRRVNLL